MKSNAQTKITSPEKRARMGERIKMSATSSGMSLKELARKIDAPVSLLYQYVRGITNVPPHRLQAIADVTGLSVNFFNPDRDARATFSLPADINRDNVLSGRDSSYGSDIRSLRRLAEAYSDTTSNSAALTSTLHEILSLTRQAGDLYGEAETLLRLGELAFKLRDLPTSIDHYSAARDIFASYNRQEQQVKAVLCMARNASEMGASDVALDDCQEASRIAGENLKWRVDLVHARIYLRRNRLGESLLALMDGMRLPEEQFEHLEEAREIAAEILTELLMAAGQYASALKIGRVVAENAIRKQDAGLLINTLSQNAYCALLLGSLYDAKGYAEQALAVSHVTVGGVYQARSRARLASVLNMLGRTEEAARLAREALKMGGASLQNDGNILAYLALSENCLLSGSYKEALEFSEEAIAESRRNNHWRELASARVLRSRSLAFLSGPDGGAQLIESIAEGRRAVETADRGGGPVDKAVSRIALAGALIQSKQTAEAKGYVEKALDILLHGASTLTALLGPNYTDYPAQLSEEPLVISELFQHEALNVPALEIGAFHMRAEIAGNGKKADADREKEQEAREKLISLLTREDSERLKALWL